MVVSAPCPGQTRAQAADVVAVRPNAHDMTALRTSGYLDRLGFEYRPATASGMFREPTKIEALLRAAS